MKRVVVAVVAALAFVPASAVAQERAGAAALGAVSGAVVLGPVGSCRSCHRLHRRAVDRALLGREGVPIGDLPATSATRGESRGGVLGSAAGPRANASQRTDGRAQRASASGCARGAEADIDAARAGIRLRLPA